MSEIILTEFDSKLELYSRVTTKSENLIRELLVEYGINAHSVTSRTKARGSLVKKLSKTGRSYKDLSDITDISGVRIVTYFEEDVDRVVEVLEKEFEIDEKNSIDKRLILDPDRFGYMSTHHVVRLKLPRSSLHEYRWFDNYCIEIQTRSILQHAWAEIEHDLGYKSKNEVPKGIRRKFSRLAGLLELADSEFNSIRLELKEYDIEVEGQIKIAPSSIGVDKSSLLAFVRSNQTVEELDEIISSVGEWDLYSSDEQIIWYVERINKAGIKSIGDLEKIFVENYDVVRKFAEIWLSRKDEEDVDDDDGDGKSEEIHRGISIFYLLYVFFAQTGNKQALIKYLIDNDIGIRPPEVLAQDVMDVYSRVVMEE
jgi:ppGpp synthetase/RelA/SpoT-type nucleotidyltranferase